jgi:hypothetical protein
VIHRVGHNCGWKKANRLRMGKPRRYNHVTMVMGGGVYPGAWYGAPTSSSPEGVIQGRRGGNGEYLVMTREW